MNLHLVGIAHNALGPQNCRDPFGELVWVFGKALRSAGHHVILYGAAGSDLACCDEFIECVGAETTERTYGGRDKERYQFDSGQGWAGDDEAWREFKMRAAWELERRVRDKAPAVILCSVGWALADMMQPFMRTHIVVEPLIGYNMTFAEHRVFPSKAWWHYMLAKDAIAAKNEASPTKRDAVIPHPIEPSLFEYRAEKEDYAMFLGRVNESKGVMFALDACQKAGVKCLVVGQLPREPEGTKMLHLIKHYGGQYMGSVGADERKRLLAGARVLLAPTTYVEPFGMIAPQAMMSGTPVICTHWGGLAESVVHGYTGYHVQTVPDTVEALASIGKIRPEVCRAWALARFAPEPVGALYSAYLGKITSKDGAGGIKWLHEPHPLEVLTALAAASPPEGQRDPEPTSAQGNT